MVQKNQGMPQNAFYASKQGQEPPVYHGGHDKIGQPVGPNSHTSTFHTETHAPGTAPTSSSHYPNPQPGFPPTDDPYAHGSDDIPGATSADVNRGMGRAIQGESSAELRHNGHHSNKKDRNGLSQFGAGTFIETDRVSGVKSEKRGPVREKTVNDRDSTIVGGEGNQ